MNKIEKKIDKNFIIAHGNAALKANIDNAITDCLKYDRYKIAIILSINDVATKMFRDVGRYIFDRASLYDKDSIISLLFLSDRQNFFFRKGSEIILYIDNDDCCYRNCNYCICSDKVKDDNIKRMCANIVPYMG